ncbi:MAG: stalk domain-containing protein, partial [Ruminiclostridium sp.]
YKYAAKDESQFTKQIVEFNMPSSAKECVEMYAKAVKERRGAIQYALYSEKLRAATKSNFEALNWVTGISSPWITGYDIYTNKDAGKNSYNIIFHWATSAGKVPDSKTIISMENISGQENWEITAVLE